MAESSELQRRARSAAVGRWIGVFAVLCIALGFPEGQARAYEDQSTVGIGIGYAQAPARGALESSLLVDVSASTGLSATWTARARLSYGLAPSSEHRHTGIAAAELLAQLDVVELVPYAGLGGGVVLRSADDRLHVLPAPHCVVGVDYLVTRSLTLELDARAHLLVTQLSHQPVYWGVTASVVWMLDP